jgi:glycerophosphoryl diester phosphodiesterase
VELFYGRFVETFKDNDTKGLDRLDAATSRIFAMARENPDFAYTVAKPDPIFRQYPKLAARVTELDAKLRNSVLECLKEAKSAGQFVAIVIAARLGLSGLVKLFIGSARVLQIPTSALRMDTSSARFITLVHRCDVRVDYWVINDEAEMRLLLERGADGLVTDSVGLAREVIRSRHTES